ncbi:chromatin assembly factor 1 subunit A-domain-containing protein, partial [Lipomyces oligophaga]|uniref:chromatin assembly factor 1 subunit A-domain-containing protein n=1 Tax=Lipomyces oligophaga TaxID=45792 RepID=UPI0034CEA2E9
RRKAREERELEKKRKQEERRRKLEEREEERKRKLEEREEERKRKVEEKEEEKKRKLEEKERNLEEKERKMEEKDKRQLKLGSFFKPVPTTLASQPPIESNPTESESDYDKNFLPFHVKAHTTLYLSKFTVDPVARSRIMSELDHILLPTKDLVIPTKLSSKPVAIFPPVTRGRRLKYTTKEVLGLYSTADCGLTTTTSESDLREGLNNLPRKFLRFCEDLRPPYSGTFSKQCKIPRSNPFFRDPQLNYNYDSELEWAEDDGDAGEDLDDDDDDDEEDDDDELGLIDDEMSDFLVAEESKPRKRILAPLVPVSRGVCFADTETGVNQGFPEMSIATLNPLITLPIDPFMDY